MPSATLTDCIHQISALATHLQQIPKEAAALELQQCLEILKRAEITLLDTPQPSMHGDSLIYELTCSGRISPTKVAVNSPKALLASSAKVPVCPTVPNPRLRMFLAALKSLSIRQPHLQA